MNNAFKGAPYLKTKVRVEGEICSEGREGSAERVKGGRDLHRERRGGGGAAAEG